MNERDGKILMTAILNNDDSTVKRIISTYFEAAYKRAITSETKAMMESISNPAKTK
ncbi:MAG: hypothetical protein MJZ25_04050 [Fibrobacter sp.]|nr:hypothetical protein [Fibrobacter sp.]